MEIEIIISSLVHVHLKCDRLIGFHLSNVLLKFFKGNILA